MGQGNWQYTSVHDGVEQFVYLSQSGRQKLTENPENPALELMNFLKAQGEIKLLIMPPCSAETYQEALNSVPNVIVVDYEPERIELFQKNFLQAKTKLAVNIDGLREALSQHKLYLEQGLVRAYIPERYARLDSRLNKLLLDDLLALQKEAASFAVNRSLKRWHTNTNLLLNLKHVKATLNKLPIRNVPHVIVGAGPSLDLNVHVLRTYKNRAVIVATDGAVQTLVRNDVVPDVVVSKEDTLMSWRFVAGLHEELKKTPLFLDLKGNSFLARHYSGEVILTRGTHLEEWAEPVAEGFLYLESGACVGHMAFNFAIASGASEIIMTGFDLAYRDEKFHPDDMPVPYYHGMVEPEIEYVAGYDGQKLKTDMSMKVYLRHFEEMISHAGCPVIDATEGGALKKGSIIRSLEKSLQTKPILLNKGFPDTKALSEEQLEKLQSLLAKEGLSETFTSYLIQSGEKYSEAEKAQDSLEAEKYLQILRKCPLHIGMNTAAFVNETASDVFLRWLDHEGICVYSPRTLTESLKLCQDLELSAIYCCDGAVNPDLLMLTEASILDVKTNREYLPYERNLWNPHYKILTAEANLEFWRARTPNDVKVEAVNLSVQEVEYGMS